LTAQHRDSTSETKRDGTETAQFTKDTHKSQKRINTSQNGRGAGRQRYYSELFQGQDFFRSEHVGESFICSRSKIDANLPPKNPSSVFCLGWYAYLVPTGWYLVLGTSLSRGATHTVLSENCVNCCRRMRVVKETPTRKIE